MYSSFDPNNNEFVNKLDARERERVRINSIEKKEDRNNYDFFF
jgi:hypothetical protein